MTSVDPLTTVDPWNHPAAVPAAADHSVLDRWDRVVALRGDAAALAATAVRTPTPKRTGPRARWPQPWP